MRKGGPGKEGRAAKNSGSMKRPRPRSQAKAQGTTEQTEASASESSASRGSKRQKTGARIVGLPDATLPEDVNLERGSPMGTETDPITPYIAQLRASGQQISVAEDGGQNQPHWFVCACIASYFGFDLVIYPSVRAKESEVKPGQSNLGSALQHINEPGSTAFEAEGIPEQLSTSEFNQLLQQTVLALTFHTDHGTSGLAISLQDIPDVDVLYAVLQFERPDLFESNQTVSQITIKADDAPHMQTGWSTQNGDFRTKITNEDFPHLLNHYSAATGRSEDIKKRLTADALYRTAGFGIDSEDSGDLVIFGDIVDDVSQV